MKYLSPFLISIALVACGGDSSSSDKELFSLWNDTSDNSPLDLTGGSLGSTMTLSLFEADGSQCDCNLRLIGTESSGSYTLNNCTYDYGSSADGDPGCEAYNHSGTYSKTSNSLTICDAELDCTNYK